MSLSSTRSLNILNRIFGGLAYLALIAGILFFCVKLFSYDRHPPIWDDETSFIQPAWTLAHEGILGTSIHEDFVPGMKEHTYWMPPLLFVAYAPVAKFTGLDPRPARIFMLSLSIALLLLLFLFTHNYTDTWRVSGIPTHRIALFSVSTLLVSYGFIQCCNVFRPEIPTCIMILCSIYFYRLHLEHNTSRSLMLAASMSGMASLCHPMGWVYTAGFLFFLIARLIGKSLDLRQVIRCVLVLVVVMLPWFIYILDSPQDFFSQMGYQFVRKTGGMSHTYFNLGFIYRFLMEPFPLVMIVIPLLVLRASRSANRPFRRFLTFLVFQTLMIHLVTSHAGEKWYPIYDILVLSINVSCLLMLHRDRFAIQTLSFLILFVLGWTSATNLLSSKELIRTTTAYLDIEKKIEAISARIQPGSKVLIMGIPCDIHSFSQKDLNVQIPRFGRHPISASAHLESADIILFFTNTTKEFYLSNLYFQSYLAPIQRTRVMKCLEMSQLFDVCIIKGADLLTNDITTIR